MTTKQTGNNLKVRAVRNTHMKMSTMCGVQFNSRGRKLVSMQNVTVGNALKKKRENIKRKKGCTKVFNSNVVEEISHYLQIHYYIFLSKGSICSLTPMKTTL